jgi:hypothetical protein
MGMSGVLAGLAVGCTYLRHVPLPMPVTAWDTAVRFILGNIGTMGGFFVIEAIEAAVRTRGFPQLAAAARFLRYAYIPVAILLLMPPVFNWLERNRQPADGKRKNSQMISSLKMQRSVSLQKLAAKKRAA